MKAVPFTKAEGALTPLPGPGLRPRRGEASVQPGFGGPPRGGGLGTLPVTARPLGGGRGGGAVLVSPPRQHLNPTQPTNQQNASAKIGSTAPVVYFLQLLINLEPLASA